MNVYPRRIAMNARSFLHPLLCFVLSFAVVETYGQSRAAGDRMISDYFRAETKRLTEACLSDLHTLEDWKARQPKLREQLFEMLSLSPQPERTDLKPVITGRIDLDEFSVEKLHFQSMPGLYVTGNLYLPKNQPKPVPGILYVCGHSRVATNHISYGNKVGYQHHGAWLARNGYVCLIIDTIQLGEIEGIHHGTYREGMWWWNARGYTPAGVEAWNCIRALDYLQSRREVDPERLGVTGRSGGGAYSWWTVALDDRIKVAAPVAGITDLHNHVVDGVVEGHCDCMFFVNTYQWDYATVAALAAPRPLLICNTDKDSIFPLDGVVRVHSKVAEIYKLYNATNSLGLLITDGPHKDTQDLQLPVLRWFNRHLKGEDPLIETAAKKYFTADQLRVFASLPGDERSSRIHESFIPPASEPPLPDSAAAWEAQCRRWAAELREKTFHAWPEQRADTRLEQIQSGKLGDMQLDAFQFQSQDQIRLPIYVLQSKQAEPRKVVLTVLDQPGWSRFAHAGRNELPGLGKEEMDRLFPISAEENLKSNNAEKFSLRHSGSSGEIVYAWTAPRGIGPSAWSGDMKRQTQIRRRFMLLGQTLDSMRVWDIRQALHLLRSKPEFAGLPIEIRARNEMAVNVLYAALSEEPGLQLELTSLPGSHQTGPDYLNVLRIMDIPAVVAAVATRHPIALKETNAEQWRFPSAVARQFKWPTERFQIVSKNIRF